MIKIKNNNWKPYVAFIALTEAVGAVSGWVTKSGMEAYHAVDKSSLTPPDIVFPIVWAILYALMGIGAARIWNKPPTAARKNALVVFGIQLAVNFVWSILYFNMQAFGFAFLWLIMLWVLILAMIILFAKVDKPAAWLQIPYLLWVTFAGYLNCVTWLLNR